MLEVPALTGRWARLEPLEEAHRDPLRLAAQDERIWTHTLTTGMGPSWDSWFDGALADHREGRRAPFAVRRLEDGQLIGSTSYLDIHLPHKRIEVGSTWYIPAVWGTRINPECKLLLLAHAFDVLGVNRVALVTDGRNERSQAAIARLGAVHEGVLRSHMISQGGRLRDTVVFSIVAAEWPQVREGLRRRLNGESSATPDAITLRTTLKAGDIGEVIRLHGVIHQEECGFGPTFDVYVAIPLAEFVRRASPRERLWLAEKDGRIVGCIAIVEASPDTAQLRWFLVTPDARRAGLGRRLAEEAIAFSRSRGYKAIMLLTVSTLKAAARLYEKVGFVLVHEKPDRMGGVEVIEQMYEMGLS